MRSVVRSLCIALLFNGFLQACPSHAQSGNPPALSVDVSSGRHPISREVYGIANYGLDAAYAKEIDVPNTRWGGDGTTRYNWEVDSSNAGFDWFFMGGSGASNPSPSGSVDQMIRTYQPADVLITVPIIPYVNKSAAWSCSFPVSVYGAQQQTNPYVHPNGDSCGNSIATDGSQLADTNIYSNHIDNSAALQKGWIEHLVSTFGTAAQGGVSFYQLDNEPYGWGNTHRDVLPNGADYPTITQLGQQYAAAIKQVDPSAMVLGPSDFTLGGWIGNTSQQNNQFAAEYYLQQMAAYEKQHGVRILDYLDEHYYFDVSSPAAQLASTRTLWDPTYNGGTWVEQWFFKGPMQLIPRFRGWVNQDYPGTKLSLSEYSIDSGKKSVVDAIAEMDVLGIFGREQLDFANMWSAPAPTDPIAYAFRIYRNYDGNGSQYGDTWVNATSSDQSQLSIYAAQRSSDTAVTILVINKTASSIDTQLALSGTSLPPTAAVYSYSSANLQKIVHATDASIQNGTITYSFPGYSATLLAFTPYVAPIPANTTTTLTASAAQAVLGNSIVLTATVSGTGSPSGAVTLADSGTSIGTALLSGGVASFSTTTLAIGTHSITATYGGDADNASSTSNAVTVTITQPSTPPPTSPQPPPTSPPTSPQPPPPTSPQPPPPTSPQPPPPTSPQPPPPTSPQPPTLTATTATLTASSSQISYQQSLAFTVTVSAATGTPTGNVTLLDGTTPIGSATLTAGIATITENALAVGSHSIVASYSGDATDAASMSVPVTVLVTQPPAAPPTQPMAATTTTVNASAAQITAGQNLTLAATVQSSGSPSGAVTFLDGGQALGSAILVNGAATFTTNTLGVGSHSLAASYSGDANDGPSMSPALSVVVASAPVAPAAQDFVLALAQGTMALAPGASGQLGVTVTPENGFDQPVQMSCTGLPAGANCSFSPSAWSPSSGTTTSLTIATAPGGAILLSLPAFFLLLGRRRRQRGVLPIAVCLLLLLTGCGYTVNRQELGTPSGTYNVQIVATAANGQVHSQQLTLTVQ